VRHILVRELLEEGSLFPEPFRSVHSFVVSRLNPRSVGGTDVVTLLLGLATPTIAHDTSALGFFGGSSESHRRLVMGFTIEEGTPVLASRKRVGVEGTLLHWYRVRSSFFSEETDPFSTQKSTARHRKSRRIRR
jgi:hypothetical protein